LLASLVSSSASASLLLSPSVGADLGGVLAVLGSEGVRCATPQPEEARPTSPASNHRASARVTPLATPPASLALILRVTCGGTAILKTPARLLGTMFMVNRSIMTSRCAVVQ
jgi:hypothetical protein